MICFLVAAQIASAQPSARVDVTTPTTAVPTAQVSVRGVLADRSFDELMRNGFPVRLHLTAELWRTDRFFNENVAHYYWDLIVKFDSFDGTYEVARVTGDTVVSLGAYKKLADAQLAAELPYAPLLPSPPRGRASYIAVQADVQTMEMSDLQEVQNWLRGEAKPAVQGRKNPGKALTRGLGSLMTRLLGAQVRHLEGKSLSFVL